MPDSILLLLVFAERFPTEKLARFQQNAKLCIEIERALNNATKHAHGPWAEEVRDKVRFILG